MGSAIGGAAEANARPLGGHGGCGEEMGGRGVHEVSRNSQHTTEG